MVLNPNTVISDALESAFKISEYIYIVDTLKNKDFKVDKIFEQKYNGYYRVRQKTSEWYTFYYSLLEEQRDKNYSFETILRKLFCINNTIEASFASKLVATIDPNKPIWDKYVLQNLGFKQEWEKLRSADTQRRIEAAVNIYNKIIEWYESFIESDDGKECLNIFNAIFPSYIDKLTDVKKIDFLLWGKRN